MKLTLIIPLYYTPDPWYTNCMQRVYEETKDYNVEVIISEDGPISDEMKSKYPPNATIIQYPTNTGCGLARKRAIEVSTGDLVTFLDSDDILHRGFYNRIIDAYEAHPDSIGWEFPFYNVEPNGYVEYIDTTEQKYGSFHHEMVWSKVYRGDLLRKCIHRYNPPIGMSPCEDILQQCVYLGENPGEFTRIDDVILTRYVRTNGLAWSTASDDRNRLQQMNVSIDYMRNNPRDEEVYHWVLTYTNIIEQRAQQQKHISGYRWFSNDRVGAVPSTLSILLTNKCNEHCSYCANPNLDKGDPIDSKLIANKTMEVLDKWDSLYGLPNIITLTGGEPTLLDVDDFLPIFDKYYKHTFLVYTNGYRVDEWMKATDNVLYKIHLVDEKVPLKYINNDKVYEMIIVGYGEEGDKCKEAISKLHCNKLRYILDHNHNVIQPDCIDKCRNTGNNYVVYLDDMSVSPCCGPCTEYGTIEQLPRKKDNRSCASCHFPFDNYVEL